MPLFYTIFVTINTYRIIKHINMQKNYLRTWAVALVLLAAASASAQTVEEKVYTLQLTSRNGRVRSVVLKNDADFTGPMINRTTRKLIFRGTAFDMADLDYFTMQVTTRTVDGISDVRAEREEAQTARRGNIYSLDGRLVREHADGLDGLGKGIYIMNGRKYVVR